MVQGVGDSPRVRGAGQADVPAALDPAQLTLLRRMADTPALDASDAAGKPARQRALQALKQGLETQLARQITSGARNGRADAGLHAKTLIDSVFKDLPPERAQLALRYLAAAYKDVSPEPALLVAMRAHVADLPTVATDLATFTGDTVVTQRSDLAARPSTETFLKHTRGHISDNDASIAVTMLARATPSERQALLAAMQQQGTSLRQLFEEATDFDKPWFLTGDKAGAPPEGLPENRFEALVQLCRPPAVADAVWRDAVVTFIKEEDGSVAERMHLLGQTPGDLQPHVLNGLAEQGLTAPKLYRSFDKPAERAGLLDALAPSLSTSDRAALVQQAIEEGKPRGCGIPIIGWLIDLIAGLQSRPELFGEAVSGILSRAPAAERAALIDELEKRGVKFEDAFKALPKGQRGAMLEQLWSGAAPADRARLLGRLEGLAQIDREACSAAAATFLGGRTPEELAQLDQAGRMPWGKLTAMLPVGERAALAENLSRGLAANPERRADVLAQLFAAGFKGATGAGVMVADGKSGGERDQLVALLEKRGVDISDLIGAVSGEALKGFLDSRLDDMTAEEKAAALLDILTHDNGRPSPQHGAAALAMVTGAADEQARYDLLRQMGALAKPDGDAASQYAAGYALLQKSLTQDAQRAELRSKVILPAAAVELQRSGIGVFDRDRDPQSVSRADTSALPESDQSLRSRYDDAQATIGTERSNIDFGGRGFDPLGADLVVNTTALNNDALISARRRALERTSSGFGESREAVQATFTELDTQLRAYTDAPEGGLSKLDTFARDKQVADEVIARAEGQIRAAQAKRPPDLDAVAAGQQILSRATVQRDRAQEHLSAVGDIRGLRDRAAIALAGHDGLVAPALTLLSEGTDVYALRVADPPGTKVLLEQLRDGKQTLDQATARRLRSDLAGPMAARLDGLAKTSDYYARLQAQLVSCQTIIKNGGPDAEALEKSGVMTLLEQEMRLCQSHLGQLTAAVAGDAQTLVTLELQPIGETFDRAANLQFTIDGKRYTLQQVLSQGLAGKLGETEMRVFADAARDLGQAQEKLRSLWTNAQTTLANTRPDESPEAMRNLLFAQALAGWTPAPADIPAERHPELEAWLSKRDAAGNVSEPGLAAQLMAQHGITGEEPRNVDGLVLPPMALRLLLESERLNAGLAEAKADLEGRRLAGPLNEMLGQINAGLRAKGQPQLPTLRGGDDAAQKTQLDALADGLGIDKGLLAERSVGERTSIVASMLAQREVFNGLLRQNDAEPLVSRMDQAGLDASTKALAQKLGINLETEPYKSANISQRVQLLSVEARKKDLSAYATAFGLTPPNFQDEASLRTFLTQLRAATGAPAARANENIDQLMSSTMSHAAQAYLGSAALAQQLLVGNFGVPPSQVRLNSGATTATQVIRRLQQECGLPPTGRLTTTDMQELGWLASDPTKLDKATSPLAKALYDKLKRSAVINAGDIAIIRRLGAPLDERTIAAKLSDPTTDANTRRALSYLVSFDGEGRTSRTELYEAMSTASGQADMEKILDNLPDGLPRGLFKARMVSTCRTLGQQIDRDTEDFTWVKGMLTGSPEYSKAERQVMQVVYYGLHKERPRNGTTEARQEVEAKANLAHRIAESFNGSGIHAAQRGELLHLLGRRSSSEEAAYWADSNNFRDADFVGRVERISEWYGVGAAGSTTDADPMMANETTAWVALFDTEYELVDWDGDGGNRVKGAIMRWNADHPNEQISGTPNFEEMHKLMTTKKDGSAYYTTDNARFGNFITNGRALYNDARTALVAARKAQAEGRLEDAAAHFSTFAAKHGQLWQMNEMLSAREGEALDQYIKNLEFAQKAIITGAVVLTVTIVTAGTATPFIAGATAAYGATAGVVLGSLAAAGAGITAGMATSLTLRTVEAVSEGNVSGGEFGKRVLGDLQTATTTAVMTAIPMGAIARLGAAAKGGSGVAGFLTNTYRGQMIVSGAMNLGSDFAGFQLSKAMGQMDPNASYGWGRALAMAGIGAVAGPANFKFGQVKQLWGKVADVGTDVVAMTSQNMAINVLNGGKATDGITDNAQGMLSILAVRWANRNAPNLADAVVRGDQTYRGNKYADTVMTRLVAPELQKIGVRIEQPEIVRAALVDAYNRGITIDPRLLGSGSLKGNAAHDAFLTGEAQLLAGLATRQLGTDFQGADIMGPKGVSSDVQRMRRTGPDGNPIAGEDVYFKPVNERNGGRARHEVLASSVDSMLGLGIIPETRLVKVGDTVGSAQRQVPDDFRPVGFSASALLRPDSPYAESLASLRTLDYLLNSGDRHPNNLYIHPDGRIMAIDNEGAMSGTLPQSLRRMYPLSGGILPDTYPPKVIEAIAKLSPDEVRTRLGGMASAAEVDAFLLRLDIVKRDIVAKHGPSAFKPFETATPTQPLQNHGDARLLLQAEALPKAIRTDLDGFRKTYDTAQADVQAVHQRLTSGDPIGPGEAKALLVRLKAALESGQNARASLLDVAGKHLPVDSMQVLGRGFPATGQDAATLQFIRQFVDVGGAGFAQRMRGEGVLAPGVTGVSPETAAALASLLRGPHSSVDMAGAANVDHLATVYEGALRTAQKAKGAPLTQAEVNRIALETVLTDATGKGRSPAELADMPTAPLLDAQGKPIGATGGDFWRQALKTDLGNQAALAEVWPKDPADRANVSRALDLAIDRHTRPNREQMRQACWDAGLTRAQTDAAVAIWDKGIANPPPGSLFQPHMGFMAGTLMHGVPDFATIQRTVLAAGGDKAQAQAMYEAVLGHHMAGFVANGFAKTGVRVDFDGLVRQGALSPEQGVRLKALYDAAIPLAGKWRGIIDNATRTGQPLNAEQRAAYAKDAAALRAAVDKLPAEVRAQLVNDDAQQFTDVGLPKWLTMMKGMGGEAANNATLLDRVYKGAAQAYFEENLARGTSGPFVDQTRKPAANLGIRWDDQTQGLRPANPGEPEFSLLARGIAEDPQLRAAFLKDKGLTELPPMTPELEGQLVGWLRDGKPDVAALTRLANRPDAGGTTTVRPPEDLPLDGIPPFGKPGADNRLGANRSFEKTQGPRAWNDPVPDAPSLLGDMQLVGRARANRENALDTPNKKAALDAYEASRKGPNGEAPDHQSYVRMVLMPDDTVVIERWLGTAADAPDMAQPPHARQRVRRADFPEFFAEFGLKNAGDFYGGGGHHFGKPAIDVQSDGPTPTDGTTPIRGRNTGTDPATTPTKAGLQSDEAIRFEAFRKTAPGLSVDDARELFLLAGGLQRDAVTDFATAGARKPTIQRATELIATDPTVSGFYLEADVRNLSGLNGAMGATRANGVYADMTGILRKHLEAIGVDVHAIRHGGDEVSFVITGRGIDRATIDAAVQKAQVELAAYTANTSVPVLGADGQPKLGPDNKPLLVPLKDLAHPKHPGETAYNGTGLSTGLAEIIPGRTPDEVFRSADLEVEAAKRRAGIGGKPVETPTTPTTNRRPGEVDPRLGDHRMPPMQRRSADVTLPGDRPPFLGDMEARRETFVREAMSRSGGKLNRAEALEMFRLGGGESIDTVTGFQTGESRIPTMQRAFSHLVDNPHETGFYVEADIKNLGGLNGALGHSQADGVYNRLSSVMREELAAIGADLVPFRHGGDEVSFVVVGPGLTSEMVTAAMQRAQSRIAQYVGATEFVDHTARTRNLSGIEHPKHPGEVAYNGTGINFGVAEITPPPGSRPGQLDPAALSTRAKEIFSNADTQVEASKKRAGTLPTTPPNDLARFADAIPREPDLFVRDPGKPPVGNYLRNQIQVGETFAQFFAKGDFSFDAFTAANSRMHEVAFHGADGTTPYRDDVRNPGALWQRPGATSRRPAATTYAENIAATLGLPPPKQGALDIPGIRTDAQPHNLGGMHMYPSSDVMPQYFAKGAETLTRFKQLVDSGAPRSEIIAAVSDYYHTMINARPYEQINNSLFMTQVNYMLKFAGMEGVPNGYIDHLAHRYDAAQFRLIFQAHTEGRLPLPSTFGLTIK